MRPHSPIPLLLSFLILLAGACSSTPATQSQNLEQSIYKAEQINTEVLTLATAALNAHAISSAEEIRIRHIAEDAHALILVARSLTKSDPVDAAAKVQQALSMLQPEKTQLKVK